MGIATSHGHSLHAFVLFTTFFLQLTFPSTPLAYTHTDSLIHWHEYGPKAFEKAGREAKPVFLLISAVWCHWCHVYEEKSLETVDVAKQLNSNYIAVFVDYDKRRDIARQYPGMGLPVTVILAPDGEKLVSVPGYISKERLMENLVKTAEYVKNRFEPAPGKNDEKDVQKGGKADKKDLLRIIKRFNNYALVGFDYTYGGFGTGSKHPFAGILDRLLDQYEKDSDKTWLEIVTQTLDAMACREEPRCRTTGLKAPKVSGNRPEFTILLDLYRNRKQKGWIEKAQALQRNNPIYGLFDHLEGGFFRYATRRDWAGPHFEKLLGENAELIRLYLHAYKLTKEPFYRKVAEKGLEYVTTTLFNNRENRFYGSQSADEIYYHFSASERKKVSPPAVDKVSYATSSARMVTTLFYAAEVLNTPMYASIARKSLAFWKEKMFTSQGVLSYYDYVKNRGFLGGQLESNAWMALAFLEGFRFTGDMQYLLVSGELADYMIDFLYDNESGGFFDFDRKSRSRTFYRPEDISLKRKSYELNAVAAYLMTRMLTDAKTDKKRSERFRQKALETIGLWSLEIPISPYFYAAASNLLKNGR